MNNGKLTFDILPSTFPKAKTENLVIQETGDELLVYKLDNGKAICLNQTAAIIWQSCSGENDIAEITRKLEEESGCKVNEDLVWFALDQLDKEDLLLNTENFPNKFTGLSRREVIKKVGFASLVALPIISSLVAPKAAYAASCGAPGTPGLFGPTTCVGGVPECQGVCSHPSFSGGCCNNSATLVVPPGGECTLAEPCTCLCA